jgi:hypothetical protein
MLPDELVEFTTRHQVYLERLKAGEIKKTDKIFVVLAAELTKILLKVRVADFSELSAVQQAKLVLDIQQIHTTAYNQQLKDIANLLKDLAEHERQFELDALNEVTIDELVAEDTDEAEAALWQTIQDRPMSATGKLLAAYLGAWMGLEVSRAADTARTAMAEGWTPSGLLGAFRGSGKLGYKDGLWYSAKTNTATTIRTAIQHVSSTARWATMGATIFRPAGTPKARRPGNDNAEPGAIELDGDGVVTRIPKQARDAAARAGIKLGDNVRVRGYRWVSILDSKTSQICRSLSGRLFRFGQGPVPPAHPNCRSNIVAELLGRWLKRDAKGRFAKDDRTQPAEGGAPVPVRTTYYEWLKTQPAEFQDDVLGVTRGALFRKGGLSAEAFARLNLDRNFEPMTLDEMRKRAPLVFKRAGL